MTGVNGQAKKTRIYINLSISPVVFSAYLSKLLVFMQIICICHRAGYDRGQDTSFFLVLQILRLQWCVKHSAKNIQKNTKVHLSRKRSVLAKKLWHKICGENTEKYDGEVSFAKC